MLTPTLVTLKTYFSHTLPARLAITGGMEADVPADRAEALAAEASVLEAFGFEQVATVVPTDASAPGTAYARVLVHDGEATIAWAMDLRHGALGKTYVELTTEWEDGTVVSTVNHDQPSIFAPVPRLRRVVVAGAPVADAVGAHRRACADLPGTRLDPRRADPIEIAQEQNAEVLAHQEACGILRRRGEDYGFTLRGARQSTFRLWRAGRAAG